MANGAPRLPPPACPFEYHIPHVPACAILANARSSPVCSILDPRKAPAIQLANLYPQRWTIETALGELKTRLRGARIVLRSRVPALTRQDFYGLLLAHFGVRALMHEAATLLIRQQPPRRSGFGAPALAAQLSV